jgi:NAD dependent epimerase/dehydratase
MNQKTKVLITGAGGFIGSHLVERCVEAGHKVRAFVHYNARNFHGWLEASPSYGDLEVVSGDIRDYDSVLAAAEGCDTVFHLAALIGIPYSYVSPQAYIRTNVEGTYNVLQACRTLRTPNVLVTSTSETYGTAQYVPIDEKHPAVGQSPYAATKIAADQLAISYYRSFAMPVKIVRPFNTYGPRQSARAIIPTVITQILAGKRELSLGNLAPTRDLTFARDTAAGFLAVANHGGLLGEPVNIGMGSEISIGDLVEKIADIMGVKVTVAAAAERQRAAASEVERLLADASKLRAATDWAPEYDLDRGLRETIAWLEKHHHSYKAGIYNV